MMRALVYTAKEEVQLQERARPAARTGEQELTVELSGICGSDMSGFLGHSPRRKPPLILGHELTGWLSNGKRAVANPLVSCGRCSRCLAGAQNLCAAWRLLGLDRTEGSFAEFVTLPSEQIFEIPTTLSSRRAVLAEPLANIVHLYRIAAPPAFFRLAIVGAGTMGALALQAGKRLGARDILCVDVNGQRLAAMKQMGASETLQVGAKAPTGVTSPPTDAEFDLVIDASGSTEARQTAFDICRPGGQVALLGMAQQRSEIDFVTSIRKEHRVVMSFAYTPIDFRRALDLLIGGEIELDDWTEMVPLENGQQAFEKMTRAPGATLKMLLSVRKSL
ncbi:MAG: alcohol dehydrogenase catalytic domain-containing protein [Acidobacteria bacterium]|nr:alcohol dehydrogenase catalytic domain-containing protein [Acidobacteriota bacterium]MBS1866315.1 alcohol dehydrogenase catalytic domain-containing protein [Acidobacteriota bacterium]